MITPALARRIFAEALGTAMLVAVVGSGIAAQHLSPQPGRHPRRPGVRLTSAEAAAYVGAQFVGGAAGAVVANVMFSRPAVDLSTNIRSSGALWSSEVVATFGLLIVIFGVVRSGRSTAAPFAVGAYIGAAYFFTSSTSFANPAVTVARTLSNTFAGIAPGSVLPFVLAQVVGAALAVAAVWVLYPGVTSVADDVILAHPQAGTTRTSSP